MPKSFTIHDLPKIDRPREKLAKYGTEFLKDYELLNKETISIGTLNANLVHPREVFEPAITGYSTSVIFIHNHPSGDPEPSEDDLAITKQLIQAGKILGIEVIDHIIIGQEKYTSFKDKGLLT